MKLLPTEAAEYFELMWALQQFVNRQAKLIPDTTSASEFARLPQEQKMLVRTHLFDNPALIEQFVEANPGGLGQDALELVLSWRNFVKGDFYIERILKKHTIFIDGSEVYGVLGLFDEFDEIIDRRALPVYVRAILLPFRGRIIYDGLLESYRVFFGGGIKGDLKETYMAAKQNRRIIESLDDSGNRSGDLAPVLLRDWSAELDEIKSITKRLRASKDSPAIWSPVFSLLRASADMAELAAREPDSIDDLWDANNKVVRALRKTQTVLERAEM